MPYPTAIDPDKVGEYPAMVYAGGGYFFDEVLEYRVWCYPEHKVKNIDHNDGESDNCHCFATYQEALEFADNTQNAERPIALVRQLEWIDQPSRGIYIHNKGERLTEWRPEWLERGARTMNDISQFLQKNS
ncbi:hypothetical protein RCH20_001764 [Psychrobacter sp. PL15]|uniref:hypothetical protein n=1 Tax=Psychrobacter sp. PL15 TaxID=3071719 RepID=UPI002DFBD1F2|nr:hypothetical protein [Psychrobacter sp. PL15]